MGQLQWMWSLIPDSILVWVYYAFTFVGLALYIGSKLVRWIPLMGQWKLPAELVGVIVLCGAFWLMGGRDTEMAWRARVAELEAKVKEAEVQSKQVNTVIQEKIVYKTKIVKEIQIKVQERIVEVAAKIDAECKVDPVAIQILNDAAQPVGEKK